MPNLPPKVQERFDRLPKGLQDHINRVREIARELAHIHGADAARADLAQADSATRIALMRAGDRGLGALSDSERSTLEAGGYLDDEGRLNKWAIDTLAVKEERLYADRQLVQAEPVLDVVELLRRGIDDPHPDEPVLVGADRRCRVDAQRRVLNATPLLILGAVDDHGDSSAAYP